VAFWTSSLVGDSCAWANFVSQGEAEFLLSELEGAWELEVVGSPRVLVLRDDADVEAALSAHDLPCRIHQGGYEAMRTLWERIAATYDPVHVPVDHRRTSILYGWDCESTAWLNPVRHLRTVGLLRAAVSSAPLGPR
jgi:hypothetical protein